jgi:hypothetical protein
LFIGPSLLLNIEKKWTHPIGSHLYEMNLIFALQNQLEHDDEMVFQSRLQANTMQKRVLPALSITQTLCAVPGQQAREKCPYGSKMLAYSLGLPAKLCLNANVLPIILLHRFFAFGLHENGVNEFF